MIFNFEVNISALKMESSRIHYLMTDEVSRIQLEIWIDFIFVKTLKTRINHEFGICLLCRSYAQVNN